MTAEWYAQSFGEDYLIVYRHRDFSGARREVRAMADWLGLSPGARVLDLCCGMGRHALALAELGYRVTGVDLSPDLLAEARKHDPAGTVTWLRGDMRNVPLDGPFDAVVNLFTSFGYFADDEENGAVLREMGRLLRPGGRFLIDFLNPGHVRRHLVPRSVRTVEGETIEESRAIRGGRVEKDIVIRSEAGGERRYRESVKLYEIADFLRLMHGTDLAVERVIGDYDGSDHEAETSPRLIMLGRKTGGGEG